MRSRKTESRKTHLKFEPKEGLVASTSRTRLGIHVILLAKAGGRIAAHCCPCRFGWYRFLGLAGQAGVGRNHHGRG